MRETRTSRRDFLISSAGAMGAALLGAWPAFAKAEEREDGLWNLSVSNAAAAMRRGDISAERYAAALLARCDRLKHLNAFVAMNRDVLLNAARDADRKRARGGTLGQLHGIPLAIKDNINTAALPTAAGTPALRSFQPKQDAPVLSRLIEAGALVLGKTNMHELAMGYTTTNGAFGATHNPYDPSRIPGGSSGGTGAAVAARMAPAGLGTDTGGSVRIPAALCGICGLRPSSGRYPSEGIAPLSSTLDTAGPMARTVLDLAMLDAAITGEVVVSEPRTLHRARIGIPRAHYYEGLDEDVDKVVTGALERLRDAGAVLIEADIPGLTERNEGMVVRIAYHEFGRAMPDYLTRYEANVSFERLIAATSPDIHKVITELVIGDGPKVVTAEGYREAMDTWRPQLQAMLQAYFVKHDLDVIAFPTCRAPAPPIPDPPVSPGPEVLIKGKPQAPRFVFGRNVTASSNAGLPGLVLPAGIGSLGLPVGMEFDALANTDRRLLALGLSIQRVLGDIPAPHL